MSRMRLKIAERLKDSQNTYALLTTFQEVDMGRAMEMRKELQVPFLFRTNSSKNMA
jgi:2-oxoglutarate dehydrogenase E2 component (dihydrolipoamide succinyltransferase)